MKKQEYAWVIAYVNVALLNKLPTDLKKNQYYDEILPHIPIIRILKKQFKGKEFFDEVPLLFNYGFFRIPIGLAINTDLMIKLKEDISCISGWVRDNCKVHGSREEEPNKNWVYSDSNVAFATVNENDVFELVRKAREDSIFSSDDIDKVKEGSVIFLMGYPFEGMQAKVVSIDRKAKKIKVLLGLDLEDGEFDENGREMTVHFENVFYSIYSGSHDENYNQERFLEDHKFKTRKDDDTDL